MGQDVRVIHTRALHPDDVSSVIKLAYKALVENGLLTVDYDETHFYQSIKRCLTHPSFAGSVGLFVNDVLSGFAIVNYDVFPWSPRRKYATLMYFYLLPQHLNDYCSLKLLNAIEDWCRERGISGLRISNKNIVDGSLLNLGFQPEERIYIKEYDND